MIQRSIWVKFEKEGIHCYPEATTDPKLADVSFLGYPHRHMFKFVVEIPVGHDNRDIEFIQFKRWCESLYYNNILELNFQSCEMIAEALAQKIKIKYPHLAWINVTVSEDDENGATITLS